MRYGYAHPEEVTAIGFASWKANLLPRLRRLLQAQQLLVFFGVAIYALLAAFNSHASLALIMISVLSIGNIMRPIMVAGQPLYERRRFPWNWIVFVPVQLLAGLTTTFACVLVVRLMKVAREPFWILFRTVAPAAVIVSLIAATVGYLISQMQRKLQDKNRQLEQAVEKGSATIQQQEQEMTRAYEIQKNLLPKDLPQLAGVEIVSAWLPARAVGGDYFDVIRLDDQRLGMCIGDVAGKGITAALLMANLQAAFRAFAVADASPSAVCSRLNEFVCGNVAPGKFITFFYAILNPGLRTITYENAGHCPAVLVKKSGQAEFLRGDGAVLGVLPEWVYKDYTVTLNSGDRLLMYTDGVTEAENQHAEEFGSERVMQAALAVDGSAANTQRSLMEEVTQFCGNNFRDDVTVLVASID